MNPKRPGSQILYAIGGIKKLQYRYNGWGWIEMNLLVI